MITKDTIEKLLLPYYKIVPQGLYKLTINTIITTIPEEVILAGIKSFSRAYIRDDKPTIEIAILTNANIIYDFTNYPEKYTTSILKLTNTSSINIYSYYSLDLPNDDKAINQDFTTESEKPYRAELTIYNGEQGLEYSAEGDRRAVNSLILFGQDCINAMTKLKT